MAQSSGAWTYLMPSRRSAAGSSRRIASRYPEPVKGRVCRKSANPEAFGRPVAMVMAYGFGDRTLASNGRAVAEPGGDSVGWESLLRIPSHPPIPHAEFAWSWSGVGDLDAMAHCQAEFAPPARRRWAK